MVDKHSAIRPWISLPAEIRLMILEAIAQQKHPGWASAASVCKEWQFWIEKRNFHDLKLDASCLDDFEHTVIRQSVRELVRHIRLEIELPKYTCRCCKRDPGTERISSIISQAIWKLFRILSNWNLKPANGNGLTLELNAYSPSDSDHWFKNYYFVSDELDEGDDAKDGSWHDPKHGWVNGQQVTSPPPSAILRLFGTIYLRSRQELAQVDSVTCLIIRRQLRRWMFSSGLTIMLNKLGGLEQLIYEPWRQWESGWKVLYDKSFLRFVQQYIPQNVKKLSIFEEFSDNLATAFRLANAQSFSPISWHEEVDAVRVVDPRIGAAFAQRSLDLEQLSVSYMINAEDFFLACEPAWTWQHLESLALTSQLLQQTTRSRHEIDTMLYEAGVTALRMPKLRTLVLWNGGKDEACAFIYQTTRNYAYLTWRGTWGMELSSRVVKVWERAAAENRSCALRVGKEQVHGTIGSHGDAIHHLDLPCRVVEPASLWQIRRENR